MQNDYKLNTNDDYEAPITWLNESMPDLKVLRTDDREQTQLALIEILAKLVAALDCEITRDSNDGQIIAVRITTYDLGTQQAKLTRNTYPHSFIYNSLTISPNDPLLFRSPALWVHLPRRYLLWPMRQHTAGDRPRRQR
jgi:hypothetical protein